jgi:glycolate oxidase
MAEDARPVLFGFETSEEAAACVAAIIGAGIIPVAMEFMDKPAIEICEAFAKAGYPLDVEALLIIEVEGSDAEMDFTLAKIVEIAKAHGVKTVRESKSAMETAAIWKGRKSAFGATGRIADYICMDGTIPTGQLPFVLRRIDEICKGYGLRVANVFHAGDGNLHPLILFDANDADQLHRCELFGADILETSVAMGGTVTGEHGVGVEKLNSMCVQFSAAENAQMFGLKHAFDPAGLLNPGKVIPTLNRCAEYGKMLVRGGQIQHPDLPRF